MHKPRSPTHMPAFLDSSLHLVAMTVSVVAAAHLAQRPRRSTRAPHRACHGRLQDRLRRPGPALQQQKRSAQGRAACGDQHGSARRGGEQALVRMQACGPTRVALRHALHVHRRDALTRPRAQPLPSSTGSRRVHACACACVCACACACGAHRPRGRCAARARRRRSRRPSSPRCTCTTRASRNCDWGGSK
jgi:hypothetical protein